MLQGARAEAAVSGRCWATVWWETWSRAFLLRALSGLFQEDISQAEGGREAFQEACLFSLDLPALLPARVSLLHNDLGGRCYTEEGILLPAAQPWWRLLEAQLHPLTTRGLLPCKPVLFYLNRFFHMRLL